MLWRIQGSRRQVARAVRDCVQKGPFTKFNWKDCRNESELQIFTFCCHAKLVCCDEDSWVRSRLEIIRSGIGGDLNAVMFGGGPVSNANKAGAEDGEVSK